MPRIMSRTDVRRRKGRRHSSHSISSNLSNSTVSYGPNATWEQSSVNKIRSTPDINHLFQLTRIKGQIGHVNRSKDAHDRNFSKDIEPTTRLMSTSPNTVSTTYENSIASESLNTAHSIDGQSTTKAGSFLPRMPSSNGDWGQYVDVSETTSQPRSHKSHMKQPQWKKFFH